MKKPAAAAYDSELPLPRKPPSRVSPQGRFSPETIARNAIARRPTTRSGRIKYNVTLLLDPGDRRGAHRACAARRQEQRVPNRRDPRGGDTAEEDVSQPREISVSELLLLLDFLAGA